MSKIHSDTMMWTYTGREVYPLNLKSKDICITDIAHHLALQNRFSGATKVPYSVAQHSCHVADLLYDQSESSIVQLEGLLHDASEAYLSDIIRPLKHHSKFGHAYEEVERRVDKVIRKRFGLPKHMSRAVRNADNTMVKTECRDLMAFDTSEYRNTRIKNYHEWPWHIKPWSWEEAESEFLKHYESLEI